MFCLLVTAMSGFSAARPDGLYAVIQTSKGKIVARLEVELVPMTVANFVGLAEGTIANAAFDPGRPYYDGSVFHRVVPGHVIQTGVPQGDRAKGPGYTFPNEIHARLNHSHAGVLNMANSGPNTNSAQFCITLGDRSYLDGDFNVFGEVVEGLDVVVRVVQGDLVERIRIERVGASAEAYHPTTESFRAMVRAAEQRVAEHAEKKRTAEQEWIQKNHLMANVATGAAPAQAAGQSLRLRYRGREVRYVGHVIGRDGPPLEEISFASGETGLPGYYDQPREFVYEPGKTKVGPNGIVDAAIAAMRPGERRVIVIPSALGFGKAGFYPPEVKGQRRFVVSPNVMLVYEVEALSPI
jgi:peptidylprolyl isomerase